MNPRKILVIRNDHIGDLVLSSCVFRELRIAFPKARICVVASNSNNAIIEKNEQIDEILIADYGRKFIKNIFRSIPIIRKIRKERFDVGIDLRGNFTNSLFLMFLAGVKYRIGFYRTIWPRIFFNYARKRNDEKHESENMLDIVRDGLNLKSKNSNLEIKVTEEDRNEAKEFIAKNNLVKFFCIAPESNQLGSQWPLEKFDQLIKGLKREYPKHKAVILGVDKEKLYWLGNRNPDAIVLLKANLRMIYCLFQRSSMVVTLNSGINTVAYVGNSNLITLLLKDGISSLNHIRPLGENSQVILEKGKDIEAEDVIERVKSAVKK